jgi:hypothetical protein
MATAIQQNGQPGSSRKEEREPNGRAGLAGQGRRPMRGRPSPEERAEHNRERLQDPQSLLLLPRTPEGRVIVSGSAQDIPSPSVKCRGSWIVSMSG